MAEWLRGRLCDIRTDEDGSILIMVPAGFLVMILLGAMAVDLSLMFASERRVADLAASMANAAAAQVDDAAFYGTSGSTVALDRERIGQLLEAERLLAEQDPGLLDVAVSVAFPAPLSVAVTVTADIPYLFLDAIPGMGSRRVDATSVASLVLSP